MNTCYFFMTSLFNPDYLQHLCHLYGLRPSRQYGQNYLVESSVIETILAAAELMEQDTVVEIGAGFGTLTLALAERTKKVFSFEIEKKLKGYWEKVLQTNKVMQTNKVLKTNNGLEIIWGNVLREAKNLPFFQSTNYPHKVTDPYKVVANLPYQITSPIIRFFLEAKHQPVLMVLMVQKEVAERICARPGDMSLLSVAVQYYAEVEIVATISRQSFWPAPAVDSAIIRLRPKKKIIEKKCNNNGESKDKNNGESEDNNQDDSNGSNISSESFFFKVVKLGFAHRRKVLIKNLKPLLKTADRIGKVWRALGLVETVRAQELSLQQWQQLTEQIIHIQ